MSRQSELHDILTHLLPAAREILWCALVWNDHNFDHAALTEKASLAAARLGFPPGGIGCQIKRVNLWMARIQRALEVPRFTLYACKGFTGHYPVGTSAIVVAPSRSAAADMLAARLASLGLEQKEPITEAMMVEIDDTTPGVLMLNDGNY